MIYHILNGDAMTDRFRATGLEGNLLVARECLVEGDLSGDSSESFYRNRAAYLSRRYGGKAEDYYSEVVSQFDQLLVAPENSVFHLWFGYDLFCRANMWYVISLLEDLSINKNVFVVYPSYLPEKEIWKDFGGATPQDLLACYHQRVQLLPSDLILGKELWFAFKNGDLSRLKELSGQASAAFPYLEEVCRAHLDRFPRQGGKGRPEKAVEEILQTTRDFNQVFRIFFEREGVYGFGDAQVKQIYDHLMMGPAKT